jgi:hypothetical protein
MYSILRTGIGAMFMLAGPTSVAPIQPSLTDGCAVVTAPQFVDFMAWVRYTVTSPLQATFRQAAHIPAMNADAVRPVTTDSLCERATMLINRVGGVHDTTARPIYLAKVGSVYIAEDSRNRTAERYRDFVLNADMTIILAQAGR